MIVYHILFFVSSEAAVTYCWIVEMKAIYVRTLGVLRN